MRNPFSRKLTWKEIRTRIRRVRWIGSKGGEAFTVDDGSTIYEYQGRELLGGAETHRIFSEDSLAASHGTQIDAYRQLLAEIDAGR